MPDPDWLAEQFEANRTHLRAVAYRMLGSLSDADDAIQESWLRLSRADAHGIDNLSGWLTTVVGRVCLDMLRSRQSRREEPLDAYLSDPNLRREARTDPEQEALLADSVGLALLVVLERLAPAERLAFVLHDMFAVPFDEIAPIVGRSPSAARQLASRARRRVRGGATPPNTHLSRQRQVVDAFLGAARAGDFTALIALLDADIVLRQDGIASVEPGGAMAVAEGAIKARARAARPALVNGVVGVVVAPRGRLLMVLDFAISSGKIVAIDTIRDPVRLHRLDIRVLNS